MINIIYGSKGSGKTKHIIQLANDQIENEQLGDIVFITDTSRYIHDIKYQIRFTNTKETHITTEDGFLGFVQGMLEANYDIRYFYVDGVARMIGKEVEEMESFFSKLEQVARKTEATFTLTISRDLEELPDFVRKYIE
ncbi:MAG TPA: hypothetical protein PKX91_05950 [Clostridia bacterium]|jgi:chromosomal replication initiation ATPase DnaA|nr:hypothetical protein [Clostridia bacterium]